MSDLSEDALIWVLRAALDSADEIPAHVVMHLTDIITGGTRIETNTGL